MTDGGPIDDTAADSPDDKPESSTWTVGSVADEAVQLLAAFKRWAEQQQTHRETHEQTAQGGDDNDDPCRYCPVCQVIAVARKSHPEILDQLSQGLEGVVTALRAGILSQEKQWETKPEPHVQHIDIEVAD